MVLMYSDGVKVMLAEFEDRLAFWLSGEGIMNERLYDAIQYACLKIPGKRLRPLFVLHIVKALQANLEFAFNAAVAVELVHKSLLVADDLPCMDNDDHRNGLRSCHIVYGEGTALLASQALLIKAFNILSSEHVALDYVKRINMIVTLSNAVGAAGVIDGQAMDLDAAFDKSDLSTLTRINSKKTALLYQAAGEIGAIVGEASPSVFKEVKSFALNYGMFYQFLDDIEDIEDRDVGMLGMLAEQAGNYLSLADKSIVLLDSIMDTSYFAGMIQSGKEKLRSLQGEVF